MKVTSLISLEKHYSPSTLLSHDSSWFTTIILNRSVVFQHEGNVSHQVLFTSTSGKASRSVLQQKTLFSNRENRVELSYLKNANSNKPYLLYPDFTVGIGISPIQPPQMK